jgi:arylsulfatase
VYFPHAQAVPSGQAPPLLDRPHTITVDCDVPERGAEGVLVSQGGVDGGFSLFVQNNKLHYTYNYVAAERFQVVSDQDVPRGRVRLGFAFEPTGKADPGHGKGAPGHAQLFINNKKVGEEDLPYTIPLSLGLAAGVAVGRDEGSPVTDEYQTPFEFTGRVHSVTFDVAGEQQRDPQAEMKKIMARQ